jgi:CheY-like chemotaxis protein
MRLRLEFPDKYRLWAELVKAHTDRVFVETPVHSIKLGTRVPLELTVSGFLLVAVCEVVGLRSEGGRFKQGVWVRLDSAEVTKVRRFLGLEEEPLRAIAGRTSHREVCALAARLRKPELPQELKVRNLSETGALLETSAPLKAGQFIELTITCDDGQLIETSAEVTRERDENYTGVHFVELVDRSSAALKAQLERLAARPPKARQQLLVADDDADIREFLTRALSKHGFEVLKASGGNEAMALIRETKPALVLLDILMPGMDGVDICKAMRADVELAGTPVIFASALDESRLHSVADEAGATDYLSKPLTLGDLLNVVGRYLKS